MSLERDVSKILNPSSDAAAALPSIRNATDANAKPKLVRLSDVTPTPIRWLWPARIPLGKLTLLAGDPGLGKSMIGTDMAARVSTGVGWPDQPDEPIEPGGSVLVSAEDDVSDTIRPRLDAAGADVDRIVALQGVEFHDAETGERFARSFNLERDLSALEDAIREVGDCRLVVIDPVSAFLGKIDSHRNADVRGVLGPLSELVGRHGVAVVAITHLTKAYAGKAMYRSTGSLAFTAAARSAWLVVADKDDPARRLMLCVKSNLARMPSGLAYRIDSKPVAGVEDVPYLLWEAEPVSLSADEALAAELGEKGQSALDEAAEWLGAFLRDGPVAFEDIEREAKAMRFSVRTVRRAKKKIGADVKRIGFGPGSKCYWELPDHTCHSGQTESLAAYGKSGQVCGDVTDREVVEL